MKCKWFRRKGFCRHSPEVVEAWSTERTHSSISSIVDGKRYTRCFTGWNVRCSKCGATLSNVRGTKAAAIKEFNRIKKGGS